MIRSRVPRFFFACAVLASAAGLGTLWRFPYVVLESGGGTFLLPYLAALITAGFPLMICEVSTGGLFTEPLPRVFRSLKEN